MPKFVELSQDGGDWHTWRNDGLGGSDAYTVMGKSPWKTVDQLIDEKSGGEVEEFENERTLRGKRLEPVARKLYEEITGRPMRPICVIHDYYPWLRASLDGWSDRDQLALEIKCVSDNGHLKALKGTIPYYYKAQVQHQLLVTGRPFMHYWSYTDAERFPPHQRYALVVIHADVPYQLKLFEKEKEAINAIRLARLRRKG